MGVARKAERAELIERLRAFRGRLPADFKFDRDDANAR
jgi:antitoxin MazE